MEQCTSFTIEIEQITQIIHSCAMESSKAFSKVFTIVLVLYYSIVFIIKQPTVRVDKF